MSLYSLKITDIFSDPPVVDFQMNFFSKQWDTLLQQAESSSNQTRQRRKAMDLIQETKREIGYKMYRGLGDQNGLLLKARPILKELIDQSDQTADHVLYGYVNKELAKVYTMICDPKRAYKYLKSAVKSLKKVIAYDDDAKHLIALALTEKKLAETAREYKPQKQQQALLDGLQALLQAESQSDLEEIKPLLAHYYLDLGQFYQSQKDYPKALDYFENLLSLIALPEKKPLQLPDDLEYQYKDLYAYLLDLADFFIEQAPEKKEEINEMLQLYYRRRLFLTGDHHDRNLPEFYEAILDLARLYDKSGDLVSALKLIQESDEIENKALKSQKAKDLIQYSGLELGLACFRLGRFCEGKKEKELAIKDYQRAKNWFEGYEKDSDEKDQRIARLFIAMCDIFLDQNLPYEDQMVLTLSDQALKLCHEVIENLNTFGKDYIMLQAEAIIYLAYTFQALHYITNGQKGLYEVSLEKRGNMKEKLIDSMRKAAYDKDTKSLLDKAFYYARYLERRPGLLKLCREY